MRAASSLGLEDDVDEALRRLIVLGREHYRANDYEAAERVLTEVLDRHRGFADVFNMLGVIWHGQGKLAEAQQAFESALQLNPAYTEAALNLAVTYNDLGKYADARTVYAKAIQRTRAAPRSLDPYVQGKLANMHADLGAAYAEHALYPEAVREYHKALELCPTFGDLRTRLAAVLRDAGDVASAARELEIVKTTQPRYLPARLALGTALFSLGRRDDAVREWEAVLAIDPDSRAARLYLRVAHEGGDAGVVPREVPPSPSENTLDDILAGYRDRPDGEPSGS
jgi:tetratricopeptide (TPR) repeat protein